MSFLFAFALAAAGLVVAPYFAHRLRRRRAETRPFAPSHLVLPAPPRARQRSALEDRALFATRALAVLGLALLGASPFVRCSRLSLARSSGASVALAIVLDDSLSMQAKLGTKTRFARAKQGAAELLASTREGDAVAIVLAGAPARVALAPTTDLGAARALLESIPETDRGTDLDGALALARTLLSGLPQVDPRVVLLSDLADGHPDAEPLGLGGAIPVWNGLPEIRAAGHDCAIAKADRVDLRVRVEVICSPDGTVSLPGERVRQVTLVLGDKLLTQQAAPATERGDVVLTLPVGSVPNEGEPGVLVARLEPSAGDAIPADDQAPVLVETAKGSIAVVVPGDSETAATGGAPVVEQALTALQLDVNVVPLPQIPDRSEDLAPFLGILLDDPPGFTPEERRALGTFVENGGAVLLALGPRAASPPLGASLEPFVSHPVVWEATTSAGADPRTAVGALADSARSLTSLGAPRRSILRAEDRSAFAPLVEWGDHAPLVTRRSLGQGDAWVVTLPFALDASELPLRPAFLSLLGAWVEAAGARRVPQRTEVGATWTFPGVAGASGKIEIVGPKGEEVHVAEDGSTARASPDLLGLYHLRVAGRPEVRVTEPVPRELDLRPRKLEVALASRTLGDNRAAVDASPALSVALLALLTLELALRMHARRKAAEATQ